MKTTEQKLDLVELGKAIDDLNQEMAEATELESTDRFLTSSMLIRQNLVNELYLSQDLINRVQIYQVSCENSCGVIGSTKIYIHEMKKYSRHLGVLINAMKDNEGVLAE